MEMLRKNKNQMLEIKKSVREMKIAFGGLLSGLGTDESSISLLKYLSIETSQLKCIKMH